MKGNSIFYNPAPTFCDAAGNALVGGKVYFYATGTVNLKNTYSDAALSVANPNPITLDANGRPAAANGNPIMIFYDEGDYAIKLENAQGVEQWNRDPVNGNDFKGLTATVDELNATNTSCKSISANYTMLASDRGKLLKVDTTAGDVTITMLAGNVAGNGYTFKCVKDSNDTNKVIITGALINGVSNAYLNDQHEYIEAVGDGVNYILATNFDISQSPTGMLIYVMDSDSPEGYIPHNGGTISGPAHGGTIRAATDMLPLYTKLWNKFSNTSANAKYVVSGGLGVSAQADFTAGKTMTLANINNMPLIGATSAALAGTITGADTETLTEANLASHTHTLTVNSATTSITGASAPHTHAVVDPGHTHTPDVNMRYYTNSSPTSQAHSPDGIAAYQPAAGTLYPAVAMPSVIDANTTGITNADTTSTVSLTDPGHPHTATAAATGSGTAFNIRQQAFNAYLYIKY